MSDNKLEIKILTDENDVKLDINSMSLVAAQKLSSLIESVTKIVELTPNNEGITIEVSSGSICLAAHGEQVTDINNQFLSMTNKKLANQKLFKPWRNIQKILSANGLQYEANFVINGTKTSFYETLVGGKKLRAKRKNRTNHQQEAIHFIQGKLIAVGGKIPNIHVDNYNNSGERLTIGCTEISAIKAKAYLYENILLSAWKLPDGKYQLCDSYAKSETYTDLEYFIQDFNKSEQVTGLKKIHYKCREFLDKKDYKGLRRFLRLFDHESSDPNTLKIILIITQSFKDQEDIYDTRQKINKLFDEKLKIIRKNKLKK